MTSKVEETSAILVDDLFTVHSQVASINRIPKPNPKVQKPTKNEAESGGTNADNSNSTSTDSSSSSDPSADNSGGASGETVTEESEVHDEL